MADHPKGGAPAGNVNSVRHGQRSKRDGVVLAKLGRRFNGAYHDAARLRRAVERLVSERCGGLTLRQRMRIQSACRLELSIRALEMGIRDEPKMGISEMRACRESIARWTVQRDNVLVSLLGDDVAKVDGDAWAAVDRQLEAEASAEVDQDGADGDEADDGMEDGQAPESPRDGDVGDQVADGDGDVWREADEALGLG